MASTNPAGPPAQSAQSDDQPLFSYDDARLPSSHDHIRLLDLDPSADRSSPIVCHLSCHAIGSSSDAKPFTALSYAWGSPARTHQATIDGKQLGITTSLDEALRHLRESESVLTLWIDQICINQADNAEKSDQVALMAKIFSAAQQVLVWLGPAADDSDRVMELWRDVGLAVEEHIGDGFLDEIEDREVGRLVVRDGDGEAESAESVGDLHEVVKEAVLRASDRSYEAAIAAWHRRPWFSRVWVLQEYILSTEAPVYVCGAWRVEAHLVDMALSMYSIVAVQVLSGVLPVDAELHGEIEWMGALLTTSTSRYEVARCRMLDFNPELADTGDCLLHLLYRVYLDHKKEMHATDERDRIFALLALASDSDTLGLRADYSIEDSSLVFAMAAKTLIQKAGQLELLSMNQFPKAPYPGLKTPLPTWAPDWRSRLAPSYGNGRGYYSASRDSSLRFVETSNDRVLGLQGIVVCTIAKMGEEWSHSQGANRRLLHLSTIDEFCKESVALGVTREGAVWRTPIGDLYHAHGSYNYRRTADCGCVMEELQAEYSRFLQMTQDLVPMGFEGSSINAITDMKHARANNCVLYMLATANMSNKRAFLTKAGYVGMGPAVMTEGDAVVIFAGAEVPHILRQTSDKHWEYVGEAYCDGIMDGEAWVEEELQTFYLV